MTFLFLVYNEVNEQIMFGLPNFETRRNEEFAAFLADFLVENNLGALDDDQLAQMIHLIYEAFFS